MPRGELPASFVPKVVNRKKDALPPMTDEEVPDERSIRCKAKMDSLASHEERRKMKAARKAEIAKRKLEQKEEAKVKLGRDTECRLRRAIVAIASTINSIAELRLTAEYEFTGNYDPFTDSGDKRDHNGEDVNLFLESGNRRWWIIYDAKSSEKRADEFNLTKKFIGDQKRANLKKAIVTKKNRLISEIIREIVEDVISVNVSNVETFKTTIIEKALTAA